MKNCENELRIIGLVEEELTPEEREDLSLHIQQCPYCRSLYNEYTALKSDTASYYSSIDFDNKPEVIQKNQPARRIFRKTAFAFSAAASFVLGFLLMQNNLDTDNNQNITNDSTYNITEEPVMILNGSKWNLELNLIQLKIELLSEQMKQ